MNEEMLQTALFATENYMNVVQLAMDLLNEYIESKYTVTDHNDAGAAIANDIRIAVLKDFEDWVDKEVVSKINAGFAEVADASNGEFVFIDLSDEE